MFAGPSLLASRCLLLLSGVLALAACGADEPSENEPDAGWADASADVWLPEDAVGGEVWDVGDDIDEPRPWPRITRIDVRMNASDFEAMHADPSSRDEHDAEFFVDGERYVEGEVELHGGFARTVPKLSYRIKFDDDDPWRSTHFGPDEESHRRLVLQASWIDPTFIRNCLTLDLVRELGGLAPRCQYVALSFNGSPRGLYVGIERVDREYLLRNGLSGDGLVLKASSHQADWAAKPDSMAGFELQINEDAPTQSLDTLLRVCTETPTRFEDFEREVAPWIDLGDVMVWHQAHTLADNRDTFTKNYYLHYDWVRADSPFRLITWDADATWGRNWDGALVDPSERGARWGTDRFSPRLFSIERYREPYEAQYRADVDEGELRTWLHEQVDARAALIAELAEADAAFWQPEIDFEAEVDALHDAIDARFDAMQVALAGPPGD